MPSCTGCGIVPFLQWKCSFHKSLDTSLISDYNPEYEIGLKGEDDI